MTQINDAVRDRWTATLKSGDGVCHTNLDGLATDAKVQISVVGINEEVWLGWERGSANITVVWERALRLAAALNALADRASAEGRS